MKKRILALSLISVLAFACTEKKETVTEETPAVEEVVDGTITEVDSVSPESTEVSPDNAGQLEEGTEIVVKGRIMEINQGKDGYTAKMKSIDGKVYQATISIPNLKDPKQYKKFNVGDLIKVKGKTFGIEEETIIKVEELL